MTKPMPPKKPPKRSAAPILYIPVWSAALKDEAALFLVAVLLLELEDFVPDPEDEEPEPELPEDDEPVAVAVGADVMLPVPAEPACASTEEQVPVAEAAAWRVACPSKSHASDALFCAR